MNQNQQNPQPSPIQTLQSTVRGLTNNAMQNQGVTAGEVITMHVCGLLDVYMTLREASRPQIIKPQLRPPGLVGLIAFLLLLAQVSFAAPPVKAIPFGWFDNNNPPLLTQYYPNTNNYYLLIGTNNLAAPIATWPVLMVITNWGIGAKTNVAGVVMFTNSGYSAPAGDWYFSIIVASWWGTNSPPSNVAQTGPASALQATLEIR